MKLTRLLTASAATLMACCPGARAAEDSAAAEAAALALAQKLYPTCALACLAELVPTSGCSLTDIECLCTNVELNTKLAVCVLGGCNQEDALLTKNGSSTMCGVPPRDDSAIPTIVAAVGFGIALFVYILRMCSCMPTNGRQLGWDDWTITATVLFTVPPTVFAFLLSENGLGKDMWTLPLYKIENVLFFYFLGELFYFAAQSTNKISILVFLLRVFQHNDLNKPIWAVIGLCLAYAVSFFFATFFQCWPINHAWMQLEEWHQGHCNNIHLQGWLSAIFNIILDIIILALPLKELYKLHVNLQKKLMLMVMFSLGIFVTIASIIRLRTLVLFANSTNITYDYMEAAYWSTIELYAGIVTASLPAVYKLFSALGLSPTWATVKQKVSGASGSTGKTPKSGTGSSALSKSDNRPKPRMSLKRNEEPEFIRLDDVESGHGKASRAAQACVAAASVLVPAVEAFPTAENFARLTRYNAGLDDASAHFTKIQEELFKLKEKRLAFDPLTEPIDITGENAFVAPDFDAGDQRGPCPGLNALANHNYISHDGIVGFVDLIDAVNTVFGMGIELTTVLAIMGTVGVGNPISLDPGFSIGGAPPDEGIFSSNILGDLFGLLGKPRGLGGSHNWIEGDSSNTRDDLYVTGDASTMNMTLFKMAYNSVEGDVITMEDIGNRAAERFQESISINPYFYYGPYTGLIARNAGYAFAGRILSNHSEEFPEGQLTKDVFKSFFAVVDDENGEMVYRKGEERIPENWYRTPVEYGLVGLNLDLVSWVTQHPELGSVGGNLGRVDTFTGLDLHNVTGGVLNAESLLEGNNLLCFALAIVKTFAPSALAPLFKLLEAPLKLIEDAVAGPLADSGCPAYQDLTMGGQDLFAGLANKYPGANMSGSAL
ncbi:hypothetical protein diail_4476 [Diaporthe ilicicola]|nr:hypothetical protein diail_4476 [Diaporthe ilicicola]